MLLSSARASCRWSFVLALCFGGALSAQQGRVAASLACPDTIAVTESITAIRPWQSETSSLKREFERISVYNGTKGGEEYDLAPDDEKKSGGVVTQTWNLKGYRTMNVFLRCRYHDTTAVLWTNVPPQIEACALRFRIDAGGRIVGKSSMECH